MRHTITPDCLEHCRGLEDNYRFKGLDGPQVIVEVFPHKGELFYIVQNAYFGPEGDYAVVDSTGKIAYPKLPCAKGKYSKYALGSKIEEYRKQVKADKAFIKAYNARPEGEKESALAGLKAKQDIAQKARPKSAQKKVGLDL